MKDPKPLMNPYLAGVLIGLALLLSFLTLGAGLGASGAIARAAAALEGALFPEHVANTPYFGAWGANPLAYYLVFMVAGVFLGGLVSAVYNRRLAPGLERGAAAPMSLRTTYALVGGLLVGFASRLARGCTSGLALTGGAELTTGAFLFIVAMFATGFASARFFRRQWHD